MDIYCNLFDAGGLAAKFPFIIVHPVSLFFFRVPAQIHTCPALQGFYGTTGNRDRMKAGYKYPGEELAIFEQAYNWKKYFAKYILPFVGEKVLEVGAGMGTTTIHLNNNTANEWVLLEPDLKMAEELKTKTRSGLLPKNCKPVHGTFGNLDQSSRFDTI